MYHKEDEVLFLKLAIQYKKERLECEWDDELK